MIIKFRACNFACIINVALFLTEGSLLLTAHDQECILIAFTSFRYQRIMDFYVMVTYTCIILIYTVSRQNYWDAQIHYMLLYLVWQLDVLIDLHIITIHSIAFLHDVGMQRRTLLRNKVLNVQISRLNWRDHNGLNRHIESLLMN